jgi:hypothetical protein
MSPTSGIILQKLFLCIFNYALRHEGEWGSGHVGPLYFILALDGDEWLATRPGRFTAREIVPHTHWIGVWVGLDFVEGRKILLMPGFELWPPSAYLIGTPTDLPLLPMEELKENYF